MKKIYFALLSLVAAMMTLSACSSEDPFTSATENDDPRFLRPSSIESGQSTDETIFRNEPFNMEVLVIPVDYTKVEWIIDDEVIAEGTSISREFKTGSYKIKVLATTTMGKTTHRFVNLTVKPLETDPKLAADEKARWFTPGTVKTISGENIDGVTAVYVDGVQATDFENLGGKLRFTVPAVPEGNKLVEVENAEGRFSCGFVKVTNELWVEPATTTITLWEGEFNVTWSSAFEALKDKSVEYIGYGTFAEDYVLRAYVTGEGQGAATTAWWNNFTTCLDGDANRGDIMISGDVVMEYTFTKAGLEKLVTEKGLIFVGDGYTIKKITLEKAAGETTLWQGEFTVTWSTAFEALKDESVNLIGYGTFAEGKTLRAYVTGEGQGAATTAWWNNFTTCLDGDANRGDIMISGDVVMEYTLNKPGLEKLITENGLIFVGDGYTIKRITIE